MKKPKKFRKKSKILSNILFRTVLFVFSLFSIKPANALSLKKTFMNTFTFKKILTIKNLREKEKEMQKVLYQLEIEQKHNKKVNVENLKKFSEFKQDLNEMRRINKINLKDFADKPNPEREYQLQKDHFIISYFEKLGFNFTVDNYMDGTMNDLREIFSKKLEFYEKIKKNYLKNFEDTLKLKQILEEDVDSARLPVSDANINFKSKFKYKEQTKNNKSDYLSKIDLSKKQNHLAENQSYKKLESLDSAKNQKNSDEKKDENFDTLTALIILYYIKSLK